MHLKKHIDGMCEEIVRDSLIRNLERWVQYLDSSSRHGTPLSQDGIRELKELLVKTLERIEENEKNIHTL